MIGHYLPNNNENATVAILQNFLHLNKAQTKLQNTSFALNFLLLCSAHGTPNPRSSTYASTSSAPLSTLQAGICKLPSVVVMLRCSDGLSWMLWSMTIMWQMAAADHPHDLTAVQSRPLQLPCQRPQPQDLNARAQT